MKLKNILNEGRPIPMDAPNEFAYLDFKKFAYKNRKQYKKDMQKHIKNGEADSSRMFMTASAWWYKWAYHNNKEFTHIKDKLKFGRELMKLLVQDDLIFDKKAWKKDNRITHIKEAYQKDGHKYNTEEVGTYNAMTRNTTMDRAFVGKDGILGINNVFISWSEIKRLQKKYRG